MPLWLSEIFEKSSAFMPHGHCYLWIPGLLWLHVISDILIGIAYIGISLILYILVRKIRLPFSPVFIAFGLFIGLCGLTHFMAVWTVWNPDYWADGLLKAATAAASVATAIGLLFVKPQVEEVVHAARLSEERRIQLETKNAELETLYRKVKDLDELKTQFFANVSHELRTPLTLILGPAEHMVGDTNLTDQQKRQLESISRNSKSLLKQVNDLLDIAQLEEGRMQIHYARLDLAPWFQRIASRFEIAAEHRHIRYRVSAPKTLAVEVDPDMLERVFINLLSNAFKFTPMHGHVHAELHRDRDKENFSFSVTDTGSGISAEQHQAIFERFRQTDGGTTRQHGGSGLGLAIAKDFVDLHGGHIDITSAPGGGAKFTVRVPLHAPASVVVQETPYAVEPMTQVALDSALHELTSEFSEGPEGDLTTSSDRPSVLVVEDTAEVRQLIADTLGVGYNVITAVDGQEGLTRALALQPDLIVTDIMMPRMSGDQLVSELRSRSELNTIPILLLTAKADDELRVKLLQSGAQDYLTKPFLPQELLARVNNLISIKRAGDALRVELVSASNDVEGLAKELAIKHRQLQLGLEATEVAREQAERASQVKGHFLALISHELRTPLSTINMNAQLLDRHGQDQTKDSTRSHLQRLVRATQQLSTLIEGLLEYTRAESGRIEAHWKAVDTIALAKEVLEIGRLQITSPEVSLLLAPPPENVTPFVTDPRLLRVVLNNLVANALKFTQQGTVTLRLGRTGDWHSFEVQDTGIGIPEEDIHRIFMPFEQLEPVQRKTIPGVGLGLALIKEIAAVLGGKVGVVSETGKGSTFRVLLPIRQM